MKTTTVILLLSIIAAATELTGCRSHPTAVNSTYTPPIYPMGTPQPPGEMYMDPATAALSGTLVLKGEIPRPLYRTKIQLYRVVESKRTLVTEFSSDANGSFQVTRKTDPGVYELQVADPRYQGSMTVTLTERPAMGLILEVSETTRAKK